MKFNPETGQIILRVSLSLLFLVFGIMQIYSPSDWTGFVPDFLAQIISSNILVMINGSLEILLGLMMLAGFYLRISSFLLGVHLFGIAFSMGFSALAIRDYALSIATISLLFLGPDKFCIDWKIKNKKEEPQPPMAEI